jgi:hypothetical protein
MNTMQVMKAITILRIFVDLEIVVNDINCMAASLKKARA